MKDVLFFAGIASTVYGVWQIHRPSAWIVGGLVALAVIVLIEREALLRSKTRPRDQASDELP